jgi:hypothetical protein
MRTLAAQQALGWTAFQVRIPIEKIAGARLLNIAMSRQSPLEKRIIDARLIHPNFVKPLSHHDVRKNSGGVTLSWFSVKWKRRLSG